ncbi:MAG: hypothetical protein KKG59_07105 [Nanoarchaeota archaeon]|nr:hypothetical protein [Nanoarchaeota archaeon]
MSLRAVVGKSKEANTQAMLYAFENAPALVIDCANFANPHRFSAHIPLEKLHEVFVVEVELIYTLRDALKIARKHLKELNAKTLIVTTFTYVFNYQDKRENAEIFLHAWELLAELGKDFDVLVAIKKGGGQERFLRVCDGVKLLSSKK